MSQIERESLPLDVLFVGGGPAGLAGALRLRQLMDAHNAAGVGEPLDLEIAVIDKAREPGNHGISGAVFNAAYLRELIPDCTEKGAPLERKVGENRYAILTRGAALPIPNMMVPRQNRHIGDYWTISLGRSGRPPFLRSIPAGGPRPRHRLLQSGPEHPRLTTSVPANQLP